MSCYLVNLFPKSSTKTYLISLGWVKGLSWMSSWNFLLLGDRGYHIFQIFVHSNLTSKFFLADAHKKLFPPIPSSAPSCYTQNTYLTHPPTKITKINTPNLSNDLFIVSINSSLRWLKAGVISLGHLLGFCGMQHLARLVHRARVRVDA